MRIVSVVPSLTELLFDLNLGGQIVGITRFCVHPKNQVNEITKVGGTKSLKIDRILELNPSLIIANKEDNSKSDIEQLQQNGNVLLTEIYTIEDALSVISKIGMLTDRKMESKNLIQKIRNQLQILKAGTPLKKSVAYVIWNQPIMLAGRNTFINCMLQELNWINVLHDEYSRYPEVSEEELNNLNPDYILLSSEPFPFKTKHVNLFKSKFPNSIIILVDGEMFSWYGSRMKLAPTYFKKLLLEVDS